MDFEEICRLLVRYSAVVRYWKISGNETGAAFHMLIDV